MASLGKLPLTIALSETLGRAPAIQPIPAIACRNCGDVCESSDKGIAAESPHGESAFSAGSGFFNDNGSGLLIVPALFFIHRRYGEVAEWSKALPC
ncbi:MAG: hypothetical protein E5X58_33710 [Mesorhizobium sp.]|nr:MAG: hypothetical protein E5X58_33710 [Mesorhizobium sp.]